MNIIMREGYICTMAFLLITLLLLFPYLILILYYRNSWNAIEIFIPSIIPDRNNWPFVSVIIAARNEEHNIGECIQSIIGQTYSNDNFEVIIINDHSTDNTIGVINSFGKKNIRVINLSDFTDNQILNSYKKKSIETALKFAIGELIITTDADCILPEKWIETIVSFYVEKKPIFIAAPVAFTQPNEKDSIGVKMLSIFQSLDFMTLQGITGASVSRKFHNMCNGANLAYTKKAFYEVNGFDGIDNIASGDDMLLMHKIQQLYPEKIGFLKSKDAIVQTAPEATFTRFINQRIRWASKSDKYNDKKITSVLFLVYFLNVWMLILGTGSFFSIKIFYLFLVSIMVKIITELLFLFPVARFFDRKKILWWFVPAEPFHILYTIIAGWLGKFGSYKWKGRKVK